MIVIRRREWPLATGTWETWCVEWSSAGEPPHRRVFDNFRDALDFFVAKARALKAVEVIDG